MGVQLQEERGTDDHGVEARQLAMHVVDTLEPVCNPSCADFALDCMFVCGAPFLSSVDSVVTILRNVGARNNWYGFGGSAEPRAEKMGSGFPIVATCLALSQAYLGRHQEAVVTLQRATERCSELKFVHTLDINPFLAVLRNHQVVEDQYQAVCRRGRIVETQNLVALVVVDMLQAAAIVAVVAHAENFGHQLFFVTFFLLVCLMASGTVIPLNTGHVRMILKACFSAFILRRRDSVRPQQGDERRRGIP